MSLKSYINDKSSNTGNSNNSNSSGNNPNNNPFGFSIPTNNNKGTGIEADILINYNERFKNATPAMFRDKQIESLLSVLISKNKPNALLIGAPGTGKTRIVEDLARRIENDDPLIPKKLKKTTIYEMPLSNIMAGSSYVGELEKKLKDALNFFEQEKCIVFIDEIHMLYSHSTEYKKIAQILKPALARGDIRVIGATTSNESNEIDTDPAFDRRFSRIIVPELTISETETICENILDEIIKHYDYKINLKPDMIPTLVQISEKYKKCGTHRPDTAITLMDRTFGNVFMKLTKLLSDPATKNLLPSNTMMITKENIEKCASKLISGDIEKPVITKEDIVDSCKNIKGQQEIIETIAERIYKNSLGLFDTNQPLTFLLAGKSGVGKTEFVKQVSKTLFNNTKPIILNMTEYANDMFITRITGSSAGYIGSESNKEKVFDSLESNPYQVILLDEFEKGSKGVQRLFMQVFDEGYLQLANGKEIDFSKTVIFATTNAGETDTKPAIGFNTDSDKKEIDINQLSMYFDIELINRFKFKIRFNDIDKTTFKEILADIYEREIARIKSLTNTALPNTIDTDTLDELTEKFIPELGARPAMKLIKDYIEDNI